MGYQQGWGEREAWRLAGQVFNVLLVGLVAAVLLVPGLPPDGRALATALTRIMLLHALILELGPSSCGCAARCGRIKTLVACAGDERRDCRRR